MLDEWNAQEFDQKKAKIKRELLSKILPVTRPHAYLLAGQPGAGKSTIAKIFTCKHQGNIAFISGDDYRNIMEYAPYVTREKVEDVLREYKNFSPKAERGRYAR